MANSTVERRLAAIIAMDVVGYSRLMGVDEVGTLNALKADRAQLVDPAIAAHRGRLVKTTGDGLLLEFASVLDAIACAVAIQRGMLSRNAKVPEEKRIVFRIGVNIGDIIIDGGDIYGDGVNVAARLEAMCEPGGLCISRAANEQVRDKLSLSFADLGEHMVKNIARAVGVFGLAAKDIATLPEIPIERAAPEPATRRRATPLAAAAAGAVVLVALAGAAAWWWAGRGGAEAPSGPIEAQLAAALARSQPATSPKYREEASAGFAKLPPHRAIAIARQAGTHWRTGDWTSREAAEEKALEKCQQVHDEACALVAVDDALVPAGADGSWPVRDMPRVRYAGLFNPERIPALRPKEAQRPEVAAYPTSPAPKAIAFHANTALHIATGAASQREAEERVLRACNDDPARRSVGGPCYLYAIDNRVVLPLRSTTPVTAPPPAASPAPAPLQAAPASPVPQAAPAPAAPADAALRTALLDIVAKLAPSYQSREAQVREYVNAAGHKALAVFPPSGSWRTHSFPSASVAEERALEACHARHGEACVLIAIDDAVQRPAPDGTWPRRPMPRAAYDGLFDPQQIPNTGEAMRRRPDVAGYRAQPGVKAAAFHPWGRLFIATDAATQRAAEEQSLAECNGDPQRNGQDGPCLLYAVADQVVLPKRLRAPMTAAP